MYRLIDESVSPGAPDRCVSPHLQAAEAAKKARELVRRKNVLTRTMLPGKLADCTSEPHTQSTYSSLMAPAGTPDRPDLVSHSRHMFHSRRRTYISLKAHQCSAGTDCSSLITHHSAGTDRSETEIFVVEGDSAGGSAKQARDRRTQAVLPLRGKILNVERQEDASLLKNNEIANLIVALGLGTKVWSQARR